LSTGAEAERYNFIREKSGLSKKGFAESLGLSMNMGFQISTGRVRPSREVMERLSSVYHVNLHWFITGEGGPGYNPDTVEIELLEQEAAAGQGRDTVDYPEKHAFQVPCGLISPYRPEKLQALYAAGDSMVDEKINDGDIVIFHPGLTEGNGIFVISVGNTLVVKRVDFDPLNQAVILLSANPAYPPRRFSGPALKELRIAGRVLACIHRL
jgi:SOS-response transcriptional repressor LexA